MKYRELNHLLHKVNEENHEPVTGYAVITESSFNKEYPKGERTYGFSSDNKAFKTGMLGYSIFAFSVEGDDSCRLERYLREEHGGEQGWTVDYCYILDDKGNEIKNYKEAMKYLGLKDN